MYCIHIYDICIHISFRLMSTKTAIANARFHTSWSGAKFVPWPKLGDEIVCNINQIV